MGVPITKFEDMRLLGPTFVRLPAQDFYVKKSRCHLALLPSVVMAAIKPVTYAEFHRVVTNDPHEGDPSAVYEDETPVHVSGIRSTPANIVSAVCGDSNPDAYLLFSRG